MVTGTGFTITYGTFQSSAAGDCRDPSAPPGVIALTIESKQIDDPAGLLTLCIGRPDLLPGGLALGTDVQLVDTSGSAGGCTFTLPLATVPTGMASTTGECTNGSAAAGFALTLDGMVQLDRKCGTTTDSITAAISGTVAVALKPQ
jgi:hypothetical protein